MNTLEIRNLSKRFGLHKVIDNISFSVPENCVFGFIGANGAGKTTTMKMILGLLRADGGEIIVCGERVRFGATKTNRLIGYLPDVPEFYNYMRPKEYLRLCGEIVGLRDKTIKARSSELLALVGLSDVNKKIGGFSRGMKQRLGMAQALLGEPKLLICDEPTSALDPLGRKEVLNILQQIKGKTTVIFSTHILSDVERICDRVAVLHKGSIVLESAMGDLKFQHKTKAMTIEFGHEVDSDEVMNVLRENHFAPTSYETPAASIEDMFLEVAK
ncbi:MAG: ABC transporter ATP-binding protein [Oscillospiraceae bacterium]|nr:ABC transporter ATP-binding protein [Oscillospiraceae bacterium]